MSIRPGSTCPSLEVDHTHVTDASVVPDRDDTTVLDEDVCSRPHLMLPVLELAAAPEHAAGHQPTMSESRSGVVLSWLGGATAR